MLSFIPAGLYPNVFMSEATLYAKMLRKGKVRSEISFYADPKYRFSWLKLYDRDVFLVRNTAHIPDIDFDYSYNMSIFGRDNVYRSNFKIKDVLISAHNGLHELKKWRNMGWRPQHPKVSVFGDSGGAQLRCGTSDYINPKHVIDWYNDQVDWGTALDIPPRPVDLGNRKIMTLIAEVQRRNNEVFTSRRRDDLKLLNVSHGFTLEEVRKWCETVKNKHFNGWATGSDNIYSGLSVLQSMLVPQIEFGEDCERIHIFGTSGKTAVPVLAWASSKYIRNLSMDSTNFLRGNRYRRYIHIDLNGKLHEIDMTPSTNKLTPRQRLPCQCPVCHTIGWWDAFMMDGASKAQHLLTAHNLFTILRYVQFWNVSAKYLSSKDYDALIRKVLPNSYQSIITEKQYIDYAFENGLSKAEHEFRPFLQNDPVKNSMPKLFTGEKESGFVKMATFIGLGQKISSYKVAKRYMSEDEIVEVWKRAGIKDLNTKIVETEE